MVFKNVWKRLQHNLNDERAETLSNLSQTSRMIPKRSERRKDIEESDRSEEPVRLKNMSATAEVVITVQAQIRRDCEEAM